MVTETIPCPKSLEGPLTDTHKTSPAETGAETGKRKSSEEPLAADTDLRPAKKPREGEEIVNDRPVLPQGETHLGDVPMDLTDDSQPGGSETNMLPSPPAEPDIAHSQAVAQPTGTSPNPKTGSQSETTVAKRYSLRDHKKKESPLPVPVISSSTSVPRPGPAKSQRKIGPKLKTEPVKRRMAEGDTIGNPIDLTVGLIFRPETLLTFFSTSLRMK